MAIVEFQSVSKKYAGRIHALDSVSLKLKEGETVAILGPSGAGKSTLLRMVNGLETPDSGTVTVSGIRVTTKNLREVRRKVGMIFQRANLVPRASAMSNVLLGRLGYRNWVTNLFGYFPGEDHRLAVEALTEVRLLDRAWDRADRLSGGQQQRIGIARTLVQQPKLILADEPVASLDPETGHDVMRLLVRIASEHGATLVVNLHQVDFARAYAKRVVGLQEGRVLFDLPTDRLTDDALSDLYSRRRTECAQPDLKAAASLA